MDAAECVAMVLPDGECSAMGSQQPANGRRGREEGDIGRVVFMNEGGRGGGGSSNITNAVHTHTSSNKTLEACMDLGKCTHVHTDAHTLSIL